MSPGATARNDLERLENAFHESGSTFRTATRTLYVGDPHAARAVLANAAGRYREHSDFFHTATGVFGPRAAQIEIGRSSRVLLREHFSRIGPQLPALIERELGAVSMWPDAANHLLHRLFGAALLDPEAPAGVRDLVTRTVDRAVLAGARDARSRFDRFRFRRRLMGALTGEIAARRAGRRHADVLDLVVRAAPDGADPAQLAEVFLSCLFAVVGSVGFLVAWSVYLIGTHPSEAGAAPPDVVREALRLWPVAWLFERRPAVAHELDGVAVTPRDEVLVCSYLVHRNPAHWPDADEFRPGRWAGGGPHPAFLPFGWGPHACSSATVALEVAASVIAAITANNRLRITVHGDGPQIAAALAPPRFTARLEPLPRDITTGGEIR